MNFFYANRFKSALWLIPVLIAGAFAHLIVIPLAEKTIELRMTTVKLSSHKYEKAWLDSVNAALEFKVKKLSAHLHELKSRTISPKEIEGAADHIRNILTQSGVDVIKSSPVLIDDPDLSILTVTFQGTTNFDNLMNFFEVLKNDFSQYSIERMTVRKSRGILNYSMIFRIFSFNGNKS